VLQLSSVGNDGGINPRRSTFFLLKAFECMGSHTHTHTHRHATTSATSSDCQAPSAISATRHHQQHRVQLDNMTRQRRKIFDFLGLPRELRDPIYENYLELEYVRREERQQPTRARIGRECLPVGKFRFKSRKALPLKRRRNHSLMLVNKQITAEYLEFVYKCSNFTFHVQEYALRGWKCANWRIPPALLANLQQCTVNFEDMPIDFLKTPQSKMRGMMLNLDNFVSNALQLQFIRLRGSHQCSHFCPEHEEASTACDEVLDGICDTILSACNRNTAVQRFYVHICLHYREYERVGPEMAVLRSGRALSGTSTGSYVTDAGVIESLSSWAF
jgi:hypothetical protein